jgi:hypothetical protein
MTKSHVDAFTTNESSGSYETVAVAGSFSTATSGIGTTGTSLTINSSGSQTVLGGVGTISTLSISGGSGTLMLGSSGTTPAAGYGMAFRANSPFGATGAAMTPSQFTGVSRGWIDHQDAWAAAQARVAEFGVLQQSWDGYGALQISAETVANTASVLTLTLGRLPEPDVTPNPNGTLTLEWLYGGSYATMEIGKTRFSLVIEQPDLHTLLIGGAVGQINANAGYVGEAIFSLLERTRVPTVNTLLLGYSPYISP